MLPTKGYFQDIECPYYNSLCGRPYCHFRHRKKPTENVEDVSEPEKETIPTYKPTPKSELANIHNSKSHIPISYVPDFTTDRKSRPLPKFEKPTYKPTPLSILSSANKRRISEENGENIEAIKEIKQNIANVEYTPTVSLQPTKDIDFEDLSTEFDLIDEIINSTEKVQKKLIENINSDTLVDFLTSNKTNEGGATIENQVTENKDDNEENRSQQKEEKEKPKISTTTERLEKYETKGEKNSDKSLKSKERNEERDNSSKHEKYESSVKFKKSEKSKKEKKCEEKYKSSERRNSYVKEKSSNLKEASCKEKNKTNHDRSHKSSKDKHRKEEKRRKEEKHSHRKSKHGSRERSRSKEKSKDKKTEKDKVKKSDDKKSSHKHGSKGKEKHKDKEKNCKKSTIEKQEKQNYIDESSNESGNNVFTTNDEIENNFSDLDFDDEDETMLECYKIFNEYRPPEKQELHIDDKSVETNLVQQTNDSTDPFLGKKRIAHSNLENTTTYSQLHPPNKPKTLSTPGQILSNRYKIAKLAQANREQECIMNEIKQGPLPTKRPAPTLLEAARAHKLRKLQIKAIESTCLVDDIIKGVAKPNAAQQKIVIKKIAPAQNVKLIEKAKERISKIKQTTQIKTIAQTQKTGRIAHVPENTLSEIPDVLHAEKSKLPVNVRTRFLTMIADECVKLYVSKDEAFTRALNEEFSCYEKCKVLATYRNSAMLAVNRLRKEVQERDKLGMGLIGIGEASGKDPSSEFRGRNFYNKVKNWVLTEEELDIHGYPRESEEHAGRAVIKNRKNAALLNLDDNQKTCSRCHKIYQVDDDGWPLFEEECLYHPLKKRTIRGEQTYLCCRSNDDMGCATSDTHVSEASEESELEGFQKTMDPEFEDDPRSYTVYALDCEMCYTTKGLELTRVTIVDTDCKTIYESLVKPLNPIIDYNTRFSGITKEQMDKTSTSILQIQANILHLCNSRTILVGHSLESDMKALKIVHGTVIDTSVLFPHKMGLPHKRALKALASEYLRKIIQNDISGHDSAEDAITCMELIKWKLREDMKARGSKSSYS